MRSPDDNPPAVSLREYGDILRRRRALFVQTFLLILIVGVVVTVMTPPVYQASARLLVPARSTNLNTIDTANPLSQLLAMMPEYSVRTQVELLQNPETQEKVAQRLGGTLPTLTVEALPDTEIIEVSAEGPNPRLVADAPNLLLDIYTKEIDNTGLQEIEKARSVTAEGVATSQRDLENAEAKLRDFKKKHDITQVDQAETAQVAAIVSLSKEYQDSQTEQSTLQAQIGSLRLQLAQEPPTRSTVVSALADPAMQATESQIASLEVQKAGLLEKFQPNNINIVQIDAQIAALRKRMETQRSTLSVRNAQENPAYVALKAKLGDLATQERGAAARSQNIATKLAQAQVRLRQLPGWEVEQRKLERALETARANFKIYSEKNADLTLRRDAQRTRSQIISRAKLPTSPIRPKKLQNLGLATLLALFFGVCLALLQEYLDDRINSREDASRVLRLPTLGVVPAIEEKGLRLIRDLKTFSPIVECYRGLRTNLNFASVDTPIRLIAITSTNPGEGKSTTIANLATAMAMDGKRVIVVDADLRRPQQHELFSAPRTPGLTDVLAGTHGLAQVLRPTEFDLIGLVPAGSTPPNPAELIGSEAMVRLVDTLSTMADIVLFDAPPTLAVSDAVILASRVDGVLFVIAAGETRTSQARQALEILDHVRARVLGTILNKQAISSKGYYGQYYYYSRGYMPAKDSDVVDTDVMVATSASSAPASPTVARHEGIPVTYANGLPDSLHLDRTIEMPAFTGNEEEAGPRG